MPSLWWYEYMMIWCHTINGTADARLHWSGNYKIYYVLHPNKIWMSANTKKKYWFGHINSWYDGVSQTYNCRSIKLRWSINVQLWWQINQHQVYGLFTIDYAAVKVAHISVDHYSCSIRVAVFLCPVRLTGGTLCFRVVRPSVRLSVRPSVHHVLGVQLCVQRPAKTMPFQQIIMHALQCQHDLDVHLLFCVDLDLHITSSWGRLCPEKLGSNPGQGSKGINFSGWHGLHMSITVTKRR